MSLRSELLIVSKFSKTGVVEARSVMGAFWRDIAKSAQIAGDQTEKTLSGFNRAVLGIRTGLLQTAGGFILGSLIQDATSGMAAFAKSFVQIGSDIQQFKLQFTNLFKSIGLSSEQAGEQAENAFAFAKEAAKNTPFDLPEITTAILRLETFGLSVDKIFPRAVDLASALGAELSEVTQAFTNLQSRRFGESFEQFARLGIARDLLEGKGLEFDRNGSYQGSVAQAMTAIQEIIDERFGGFAESQQGTLKQLGSNFRDIVYQVKAAFGQPIFEGINEDFKEFVSSLSENQPDIEAYATAFGELFEGARNTASDAMKGIIDDITSGGGTSESDFFEWGTNLLVSFAEGILAGGRYVLEAATAVAEGIAFFFEAFSPPKGGPLKEIDVWGANLMNTFLEGFGDADLNILNDVLGQVKSMFDSMVDAGLIDTETPKADFLELVDLIVNGFDEIAAGGEGADEIWNEIAASIGTAAGEIREFIELSAQITILKDNLDTAKDALDDLNDSFREASETINDTLSDLREADRERKKLEDAVFDANEEKRRQIVDAQNDAIDAANDAGREAARAAKNANDGLVDALEAQKDAIKDAADAQVENIDAQSDAAIDLIQAGISGLELEAETARRALEDFSFQTEGIPERFTRQRRRELERIATIRAREAQDAKKAADAEKKLIEENAEKQKKAIKDNAEAQQKAIEAQIKGIRDAADALDDQFVAQKRINFERNKQPEFVPDPRIKELEDELDILEDVHDEEEDRLDDIIDGIQTELDARVAALATVQASLDAQLLVQNAIAAAIAEQEAAARALQAELDKLDDDGLLPIPTERETTLFNKPLTDFNEKLDEAREKLANLIPQEVRDGIKADIQYFADFFEGLFGIAKTDGSTPEGFVAGDKLKIALLKIKDSITNDVLPLLGSMKDAFVAAAAFFGDVLDGIDKVKAPIVEIMKALGLEEIPVFKQIIDFLEKPVRSELATIGGLLLFLQLTPVISISMIFKISTLFLGAALQLFSLLTGAGLAGAGGASLLGLAAAAATPILIAVAIAVSIYFLYKFRKQIGNFADDVVDWLKENAKPLFTGVGLAFAAPVSIPIALGFILKNDEVRQKISDSLRPVLNFLTDELPGLFGGALSGTDNVFGGLFTTSGSAITGFASSIGSAFGSALGAISNFISQLSSLSGGALSGISGFFATIGGLFGNAGNAIGAPISGLLGNISSFATAVGGAFTGALTTSSNALGPWIRLFGTIGDIGLATLQLPFNVFADFLNTVFVPLMEFAVPKAVGIFVSGFDAFKSLGRTVGGFGLSLAGLIGGNFIGLLKAGGGEIDNFVGAIGRLGSAITDVILPVLEGFATGVQEKVINPIAGIGADIFSGILTAAESLGGQLENLFNGAVGVITGTIIPALSGAFSQISGVFTTLFTTMSQPFIDFATFAGGNFINLIAPIPGAIGTVFSTVGGLITSGFSTAKSFVENEFIPFFFTTVPNFFNGFATSVESFLSSDLLNQPFSTTKDFLENDFLPFLSRIPSFFSGDAASGAIGFVASITNAFATLGETLILPFQAFADFGILKFLPNMNTIASGISGFFGTIAGSLATFSVNIARSAGNIVTDVTGIGGKITRGIGSGLSLLFNYGVQIVQGLVNGLRDSTVVNKVQQAVTDLINLIPGPIRKIMGLQSPSKVMREIGENIVQGLVNGLNTNHNGIGNAMRSISKEISNGFEIDVPDGSILASTFVKSFSKGVDEQIAAHPTVKAFLSSQVNNISVKVDNTTETAFKPRTSGEAAAIVARILRSAG